MPDNDGRPAGPRQSGLIPAVGEGANRALERERGYAETIATYWATRGFQIRTRIETVDITSNLSLPAVRSDLLNGLPRP